MMKEHCVDQILGEIQVQPRIAPQIIPNGITESICGEISNIPLVNNCFLVNICLFY